MNINFIKLPCPIVLIVLLFSSLTYFGLYTNYLDKTIVEKNIRCDIISQLQKNNDFVYYSVDCAGTKYKFKSAYTIELVVNSKKEYLMCDKTANGGMVNCN